MRTFVCVKSENNFPTAAGFASSASGYSALVYGLAKCFDHSDQNDLKQLSIQARLGSGSATRSLHGGWVKWDAGSADDGSDSVAVPYFDHTHWPDLCIIAFQVSGEAKKVSSTRGMQRTVETSTLYTRRLQQVEHKIAKMISSVRERDFEAFGELTMRDSNEFHATCLDSYPPIHYLNNTSFAIMDLIHDFNEEMIRAAYTFDAGPNAHVFILQKDVSDFLVRAAKEFCPSGISFQDWCEDPFNLVGNIEVESGDGIKNVEKVFVLRGGPGAKSRL